MRPLRHAIKKKEDKENFLDKKLLITYLGVKGSRQVNEVV